MNWLLVEGAALRAVGLVHLVDRVEATCVAVVKVRGVRSIAHIIVDRFHHLRDHLADGRVAHGAHHPVSIVVVHHVTRVVQLGRDGRGVIAVER